MVSNVGGQWLARDRGAFDQDSGQEPEAGAPSPLAQPFEANPACPLYLGPHFPLSLIAQLWRNHSVLY